MGCFVLLADASSKLLETNGTDHLLLFDCASTGAGCNILLADGNSKLLEANATDHLLLFNCTPSGGTGCNILLADGLSALLEANGTDHLQLFDCGAIIIPPPPAGVGHGSNFIFPEHGKPILPPHGKKLNRKQRRELERALAESLRTQTEIAPNTLKTLIKLPSFSEIAALEEDDLNIRLLLLDS